LHIRIPAAYDLGAADVWAGVWAGVWANTRAGSLMPKLKPALKPDLEPESKLTPDDLSNKSPIEAITEAITKPVS
jgi:hypothetical protein